MATDTPNQKLVLRLALAFSMCVFAFVGFMIARYHPSGIVKDDEGNIVLATTIGQGQVIPEDSIEIIATSPRVGEIEGGLMTHLIRTNGASYGRVKYGHFKRSASGRLQGKSTRSDTKMFLYLTGQPDTVCFKYNGQLFVTDDWRK